MRIVVCVKQVPGTNQVYLDPETRSIVREARHAVLNPYDTFAVAWAARLGSQHGWETLALSMGIPAVEKLLRDSLCRGIDRAVLLTDRLFAGADTWVTANTLAMAVRKLGGADLVLCGKMAIDGDTAQTGPELAECLGYAVVTDVTDIKEVSRSQVQVSRHTESGVQTLLVRLPAVLTVAKDSCPTRMPSIADLARGASRPLECWSAANLGADPDRIGQRGSPTRVVCTETPPMKKQSRRLEGTLEQQAASLECIIREIVS